VKLSVIICTRNRAKSLDATLQKFFEQRFSGDYDYELIVVDNNSIDETKQVIERHAAEHPQIIHYLFEARSGLTYARNAAVATARGEIIVFTDDDVLVDPNWLNEIYREFTADPELHILGGRVLLASENLQSVALLTSDVRQTFAFPDSGGFAMGANMAFRRQVCERIGAFDVRLGSGRFFAGADDTDFFYRALKAGYRYIYAPNVLVHHDHDRVSLEQACRLQYSYGKGCSAYLLKHALRGDTYAMRMVYWLIYKLPTQWMRRNGESIDLLLRRRAQVRGIIIGLIAAPLVMWSSGAEQSNWASEGPGRHFA
jgi:glycosyltransferase involved in cell wall biosynthesis